MLSLSCSIMKKTTYIRNARCVICPSLHFSGFTFFVLMDWSRQRQATKNGLCGHRNLNNKTSTY